MINHKNLVYPIILATLLSATPLRAQEVEAGKEQNTEQQGEKKKTATHKNQTAAKRPKPKSETFKPTEEISEDLSVSFPVDI